MAVPDRDLGLDTLLDLHGQTLFIDEVGHWVKFVVLRTEVTAERPHGLSYSLTLHAPDGTRLRVRNIGRGREMRVGVVTSPGTEG